MITIDDVIHKVLIGIYSNENLKEELYLKGGQALRFTYGIKNRFSRDSDFSIPKKIENDKTFFDHFKNAVKNEFLKDNLHIIDFKYTRRPNVKSDGSPDFWQGWAVEFKLINSDDLILPKEKQSRNAIVPVGSPTSKIPIDISEMEYCDGFKKITRYSTEVKVYSKELLVLEKLRAICQSHPDYKYRSTKTNRARDFYDIEQIYSMVLDSEDPDKFFKNCSIHLENVFKAKEVPLDILEKCLNDEDFLNIQKIGWEEVKATVNILDQPFSYYVQTLKNLIKEVKN